MISTLEVFNIYCLLTGERPSTPNWQHFMEKTLQDDRKFKSLVIHMERYSRGEQMRRDNKIDELMKGGEYDVYNK